MENTFACPHSHTAAPFSQMASLQIHRRLIHLWQKYKQNRLLRQASPLRLPLQRGATNWQNIVKFARMRKHQQVKQEQPHIVLQILKIDLQILDNKLAQLYIELGKYSHKYLSSAQQTRGSQKSPFTQSRKSQTLHNKIKVMLRQLENKHRQIQKLATTMASSPVGSPTMQPSVVPSTVQAVIGARKTDTRSQKPKPRSRHSH